MVKYQARPGDPARSRWRRRVYGFEILVGCPSANYAEAGSGRCADGRWRFGGRRAVGHGGCFACSGNTCWCPGATSEGGGKDASCAESTCRTGVASAYRDSISAAVGCCSGGNPVEVGVERVDQRIGGVGAAGGLRFDVALQAFSAIRKSVSLLERQGPLRCSPCPARVRSPLPARVFSRAGACIRSVVEMAMLAPAVGLEGDVGGQDPVTQPERRKLRQRPRSEPGRDARAARPEVGDERSSARARATWPASLAVAGRGAECENRRRAGTPAPGSDPPLVGSPRNPGTPPSSVDL